MNENWQEMAEAAMKNLPLEENDRLVAELLKFAPVPDVFVSEWMPGKYLIQGVENPYMPLRYRVKLLERLAVSPIMKERLKAAAAPETPVSTLEKLAGDLELPIRIAVKYHPNSPTEAIAQAETQHQTAENWETPTLELTKLADSCWSWVRQAVARNPNTPPEILAKLAGDTEDKIQLAVARNMASPGEVLDLLVEHNWEKVTEAIAFHPNASEAALVQLLPQYHYDISQRPDLPGGVLAEIVKYNNSDDREDRYTERLIRNPNTPGATLAKLIDCSPDRKDKLARHPNVLPNTLEKLAKEQYIWVRFAVYENPNTPEYLRSQLLAELATSENYLIRLAVAKSSQTPADLSDRLFEELVNVREEELANSIDASDEFDPDLLVDEEYDDDDL